MRSQKIVHTQRGFSFIELSIVLAIFGTLSGVVLFKYPDFSAAVSLNNLSRDIAIEIKRAQTSAISGRTSTATTPSFGVFFDATGSDTDVSRKHFILFPDTDNNKRYGFGADIPNTETIITTRDFIASMCAYTVLSGPCTPTSELHIVFTRPYPDASIISDLGSVLSAEIQIESDVSGATRTIVVTKAGQIRVE